LDAAAVEKRATRCPALAAIPIGASTSRLRRVRRPYFGVGAEQIMSMH
jgi:hypothetical protein